MRRILLAFDHFLSRLERIFEFDDDPQAFLRVQFGTAPEEWIVGGRRIPAGSPVLNVHLHNDHVPALPSGGADLAWAIRVERMMIASFRTLARRLKTDPAFAAVRAVSGVTVMIRDDAGSIHRLFEHLGFAVLPYRNALGRFGEFWENFYSWWVMWAYNPASLRGRRLLHLRRNRIVMAREDFMRRFGKTFSTKSTKENLKDTKEI